jgi:hypothetical protein
MNSTTDIVVATKNVEHSQAFVPPSSQVSGIHDFEARVRSWGIQRQGSPLSIATLASYRYRLTTRARCVFDSYVAQAQAVYASDIGCEKLLEVRGCGEAIANQILRWLENVVRHEESRMKLLDR